MKVVSYSITGTSGIVVELDDDNQLTRMRLWDTVGRTEQPFVDAGLVAHAIRRISKMKPSDMDIHAFMVSEKKAYICDGGMAVASLEYIDDCWIVHFTDFACVVGDDTRDRIQRIKFLCEFIKEHGHVPKD